MKVVSSLIPVMLLSFGACFGGTPTPYTGNQNNSNVNNSNVNNSSLNNLADAEVDVPDDGSSTDADADGGDPDPVDQAWYEGEDASLREPFTFLVVTDTHVRIPGNPDDTGYDNQKNLENNQALVTLVNNELAHAKFLAISGDLVGALFSSNVNDYFEGADTPSHRFKSIMDGLSIPWQAVLGNHDYEENYTTEGISAEDPADMEAIWTRVLGMPPYYSIVYRGFRFLFLNSVRGERYWDVCLLGQEETGCTGSFGDEQNQWIAAQLENPEPVVMFFHHPLHTDSWYTLWSAAGSSFQVAEEDAFYALAEAHAQKIKAIFVGHGHMWANDTLFDTIQVFETCSIGDSRGEPENLRIVQADPATGEVVVEEY